MTVPQSELVVVTFSGAHATGKTTLLSSVAEALRKRHGEMAVLTTPSFSSTLFARLRSRSLKNMPTPKPVDTYDDLNRLGIRNWFQLQLPESLSFEVETGLHILRGVPAATQFLLVDRWFPDIYAYTKIECADVNLHWRVKNLCVDRAAQLEAHMRQTHSKARLLSVYVPVAACDFKPSGQDGKFRSTADRELFDRLCIEGWGAVSSAPPSLTIAASDLGRRVDAVLELADPSGPKKKKP